MHSPALLGLFDESLFVISQPKNIYNIKYGVRIYCWIHRIFNVMDFVSLDSHHKLVTDVLFHGKGIHNILITVSFCLEQCLSLESR